MTGKRRRGDARHYERTRGSRLPLHEPVTESQKSMTIFEYDIELLRGVRMSQHAQLY